MESEGPIVPVIENASEICMTLKDDVLDWWQKIGRVQGLVSDSLIADFLVHLYIRTQDGHASSLTCVICCAVLPEVCARCQESQQNVQDLSTLGSSRAEQGPGEHPDQSADFSFSGQGMHGRKVQLARDRDKPEKPADLNKTLGLADFGEMAAEEGWDKTAVKEHVNKSYPCTKCLMVFSNKRGCKVHMQRVHGETMRLLHSETDHTHLVHCSQSTNRPRPKYPCSLCSAVFDRESRLKVHVRRHTGEKPFTCPQCPVQFRSEDVLKKHVSFCHTSERLLNHLTPGGPCGPWPTGTSRSRRVKCQECEKDFTSSSLLKAHVTQSHVQKSSGVQVCSSAVHVDRNATVKSPGVGTKTAAGTETVSRSVSESKRVLEFVLKTPPRSASETHCISETDSGEVFDTNWETHSDESETDIASSIEDVNPSTSRSCQSWETLSDKPNTALSDGLESVNPLSPKSHCGRAVGLAVSASESQRVNVTNKAMSVKSPRQVIFTQKESRQNVENINTLTLFCSQRPSRSCAKGAVSKRGLKVTKLSAQLHGGLCEPKRVNSGKPVCKVCGKTLSSFRSLRQHMCRHTGQKPYACTVCARCFRVKQHLTWHMRTHSGEMLYKCRACSKAFSRSQLLKSHIQMFHPSAVAAKHENQKLSRNDIGGIENPASDKSGASDSGSSVSNILHSAKNVCNSDTMAAAESSTSETFVTEHTDFSGMDAMDKNQMPVCNDNKFECSVCGKILKSKYTLKEHMHTHASQRPYTCSVCGSGFNSKSSMKIHARRHTDEKPFACSFCSKSFRSSDVLRGHVRTHTGEKRFMCGLCGDRFTQQHGLHAHVRRIHTKEKTHICPVCGVGFYTSTEVTVHLRSHSDVKPHKCAQCPYATKTAYSLKLHMQTHGGPQIQERKVCGVCGVSVSYSGLKEHLLIHSNVRPFECKLCGNGFKSKKALGKHMATHSEERQYRCELCGNCYMRTQTLHRHYRDKHGGHIPGSQNGTLTP